MKMSIKGLTIAVAIGAICLLSAAAKAQDSGAASAGGYYRAVRSGQSFGFLDNPMADPLVAFRRESSLANFIDNRIFPDLSSSDAGQTATFYVDPSLSTPAWRFGPESDASRLPSREDRERWRDEAKDQVYRIMSDTIFAVKPIKRLREAVEPYTRPLEVYRGADGALSPSYFGRAGGGGAGVKVFAMNIGLSSRHNLNYMISFYDTVQISLLNGTRLITQYKFAGGGHQMGFEADGGNSLLLFRYALKF